MFANRVFAGGMRGGSERRSSWVRGALRPMTEEKPRGDGGRDRRDAATSPGMPGAPRAGRGRKAPLWSMWRERSPGIPGPQTPGLQDRGDVCNLPRTRIHLS